MDEHKTPTEAKSGKHDAFEKKTCKSLAVVMPNRFRSKSFVVNIMACKLKIVNNINYKSISKKIKNGR